MSVASSWSLDYNLILGRSVVFAGHYRGGSTKCTPEIGFLAFLTRDSEKFLGRDFLRHFCASSAFFALFLLVIPRYKNIFAEKVIIINLDFPAIFWLYLESFHYQAGFTYLVRSSIPKVSSFILCHEQEPMQVLFF
jgi:hypothetical protein